MKKAIVLLLVLAVVGAFAFAVDAPTPQTYSISGDATTAWFYNVTDGTNGFTNTVNAKFTYTFMSGQSASKKGEGTYGQIEITGIGLKTGEVSGTGDKTPTWGTTSMSLSASIVSGPLTIGIGSSKGASYNNAAYVPYFQASGNNNGQSLLTASVDGTAGIWASYSLGDFGSITVGVDSVAAVAGTPASTTTTRTVVAGDGTTTVALADGYYEYDGSPYAGVLAANVLYVHEVTTTTAAVAAKDGYYLGGIDVTLNLVKDVLSLTAGAWYDPDAEKLAATGKVSVTAGDLSAKVAIDAQNTDKFVYDLAASVAYKLFEGKDSVNLDVYYAPKDTGLGHQGDVGLKFVDAGGLVAPLSFTFGVFADDLMASPANNPMLISLGGSISYKAALSDATYVKPYGEAKMDLSGAKLTYFKLGVEAVLITNVTFDANYVAGSTNNDNNHNLVAADDPDILTISAKISL